MWHVSFREPEKYKAALYRALKNTSSEWVGKYGEKVGQRQK